MEKTSVKYSCSRYATLAIFLDMLPEAERRIDPEEIATNPAMPSMEQDEAGRWFVTSFSYARWAEMPAGQVTHCIRGAIAALSEEAAEAAFTLCHAPVQTSGRRVMNREHYRISLYGVLVLSERSRKPRTRLAADAVWEYLRPEAPKTETDSRIVPFPDVCDDIDENDDFLDEAPAPCTRRRPSYSLDDDLKDAPVVRPAPDGRLYVTAGLLADAIGSSLDELRTEIEGIEYGDPEFFKKNFLPKDEDGDFYLSTAATVLLGVSCGQTLAQKIDIINAATVSPAV